ncbi:MAG: OmpA family protein [Gammaproteobacteria bacterium]|nr:OmpA family protein [Gammaproteobacteria bacterium]
MDEWDEHHAPAPPIWAVFGDLMAGLAGVFVLLVVWFIGYQLQLDESLREEVARRQVEEQRRIAEQERRLAAERLREEAERRRLALEAALADPLATGRVTLRDGRIGISGRFLFSLNSDRLEPEGARLLQTLVGPLQVYLEERDELLMVSGFTDDLPIQKGNSRYLDNWELSAQRALTVTRALIEQGMSPQRVFAAAFGAQQPIVPNDDDQSRSQNRRVEMAPVPRSAQGG